MTRDVDAFVAEVVLPRMRSEAPEAAVGMRIVYDVPPLVPDAGSFAEALAKGCAGANKTSTVNYGSEAGIFQAAGIPTVLCGPGNDTEAHVTDEWIEVEQLTRCNAFLDRLIDRARAG